MEPEPFKFKDNPLISLKDSPVFNETIFFEKSWK